MRLKHAWQKLTRGYSDADLWDLDVHLARVILPRLRAFKRENTHGHPPGFTPEEWAATLDEITWALEWVADEDSTDAPINDFLRDSERASTGLEKFGRYFMDLWD